MAKRVGVDTSLQKTSKRAKKSFVGDDDRLSQLPEGILIDILSLLSINEAARTSVLSSRWRNLWKHTRTLNFDGRSAIDGLSIMVTRYFELLENERCKYVTWVNSVLQSHESLALKEFKIRFPLTKSHGNSITQWLQFAFARQVQRLELDLQFVNILSERYCFPKEFLTLSSCRAPKLQPPSDIFKSLRELSFKGVRLNDRVIEFFLQNCRLLERLVVHGADKISNIEVCGPTLRLKHFEIYICFHLSDGVIESLLHKCPLLEQLIISQAKNISNLEVCGPSLGLKYLEIVHCTDLETLKVSLPNLTSLKVTLNKGLLHLENVPKLVEVSVARVTRFESDISLTRLLSKLSCCISQLEILRLEPASIEETTNEIPDMPKLKKLFITYWANGNDSLVRLTSLIRASPCLEEFRLHHVQSGWLKAEREYRRVKDAITRSSPHNHLKVFEFLGYYGSANHDELVEYILENCAALEKVVFDPRWGGALMYKQWEMERSARKKAKERLKPRVPHHVEFVIG